HADEPLVVPLDRLHFDDKLQFVEEPIEIKDREVKRLKRSRIPLVKVRWNSKTGPSSSKTGSTKTGPSSSAASVLKDRIPHLFSKTGPSSCAAS
ncbi:hypothetical protein Tco_0466740, partial [Tanacetum coccineum]